MTIMTNENLGYFLRLLVLNNCGFQSAIFAWDGKKLFVIQDGRIFEVRLVEWKDNDDVSA